MKRLVTFGCSHTYGESLKDRNQAWPYNLSRRLNLECINNGIKGLSIKGIAQEIDSFEFDEKDIVVILWTVQGRWSFNLSNNQIKCIYPQFFPDDKLAELWYKNFFNWEDDFFLSKVHIKYTDVLLESKGITPIHSFAHSMYYVKGKELLPLEYKSALDLKGKVYYNRFYDDYKKFGYAQDGTHLNELAHTNFASHLYRTFFSSSLI